MLRLLCLVSLVFIFILPGGVIAQAPEAGPRVQAPLPGSALQGTVIIAGSTDLEGFEAAEISFSYASSPASWFLIQQSRTAVKEGTLAVWDTSIIADGTYSLKVLVSLKDGSQQEAIIADLRVRNYSPVETNTPTRILENLPNLPVLAAIETQAAPTPTPLRTPTRLPANPLQIQPGGLVYNGLLGLAFAGVLFLLLGLYRATSGKNNSE
jgi:hypothetical protein